MTLAFIPANLDLPTIVQKDPPKFKHHIDHFYYIISLVVSRMQYVESEEDSLSGFAPINAQLLQKRFRAYNDYLCYLIDKRIIFTNNHYRPRIHSRKYKIGDDYLQSGFKQIRLTDKKAIRFLPDERHRTELLHKEYGFLTKWLDEHLEIDYQSALLKLRQISGEEGIKNKVLKSRKFHLRLLGLEKFRAKQFFPSVDTTSKRFHSGLTFLKSELRQYITYNGARLWSIDLKNSQPFISTILLNRHFYEDREGTFNLFKLNNTIYKLIQPKINKIFNLLPTSTIIMLVKSSVDECRNDLELYCTLVDKGWLYDYFAAKLTHKGWKSYNMKVPTEKRALKDKLFGILYSQNYPDYFYKSPERKMFMELFPTVFSIFSLVKEGNKANLPILLQTLESEVIIRTVARQFGQDYPDVPIFSIHDSLVTTKELKDELYRRLKEAFYDAVGLEPSLDLQPLVGPEKEPENA